jgi:hypothetical protein
MMARYKHNDYRQNKVVLAASLERQLAPGPFD